ncbi:hypothetical protein COO60DRAFT_1457112 [Scenedesmus sp. NREL 46B-D3]|nr:hypothetical protein COO60DRAFT_1457112 [Scenedesmus sp. NREL 46B-D3]
MRAAVTGAGSHTPRHGRGQAWCSANNVDYLLLWQVYVPLRTANFRPGTVIAADLHNVDRASHAAYTEASAAMRASFEVRLGSGRRELARMAARASVYAARDVRSTLWRSAIIVPSQKLAACRGT